MNIELSPHIALMSMCASLCVHIVFRWVVIVKYPCTHTHAHQHTHSLHWRRRLRKLSNKVCASNSIRNSIIKIALAYLRILHSICMPMLIYRGRMHVVILIHQIFKSVHVQKKKKKHQVIKRKKVNSIASAQRWLFWFLGKYCGVTFPLPLSSTVHIKCRKKKNGAKINNVRWKEPECSI